MRRNYVLRTHDELRQILIEWADCGNKHEVARRTGIPNSTVQRFIIRYISLEEFDRLHQGRSQDAHRLLQILTGEFDEQHATIYENYAYLLGLYLGDGHIARAPKDVLRLTIALDEDYPGIINRAMKTLNVLLPDHRVGLVNKQGCKNVSCYYKRWHEIFPQHGVGAKHTRKIELTDWQQRIVDAYPLEFFRGLYHSDGSRSQNIVKGRNYPRYQFSNFSPDIRVMFQNACDKLGVHWTIANICNVNISRRDDVAYLDSVIGAKA